MNTRANRLQIALFGGERHAVEEEVNVILSQQDAGVRVVAIEYNYQAPEVDGTGKAVAAAQHGVLLALTFADGLKDFHKDCMDEC
jgi:hypothetical protein